MIWGLLLANISEAVIDWLYIRGDVAGSLGFSGAGTVLWIIQTQCAPQIIANRLGLIIADKRKTKIMKITLFTIVGIMNIFVMSVMFPMQATRSKLGLRMQRFYSPVDKILSLLIDLSLNWVFLRKLQRELNDNGLVKHRLLFVLTIAAMRVSLAMDVGYRVIPLIVVVFLSNPYLYSSIHPTVYSIKVAIEMMMADFIVQVAQEQHQMREIKGSLTRGKSTFTRS
ncbi:uncharacterized protein BDZ83DRAFT_696637 [Colletotrichum acutatum]|uniref:Uncharacterized protein n=1 Tax=Glomerella acutata TaxID=27357 RepID=A0AAD8UQM2_GLOAC|nr:uncharacterized protein BDZ83DRAFT_696637 [Colletotrichum acutatum]KAK1726530.1 hypothetical protein BDZ83DRAFT_696637 [Colletotrichum acutatum]